MDLTGLELTSKGIINVLPQPTQKNCTVEVKTAFLVLFVPQPRSASLSEMQFSKF